MNDPKSIHGRLDMLEAEVSVINAKLGITPPTPPAGGGTGTGTGGTVTDVVPLPLATQNVFYSISLNAQGSNPPFIFSVVEGSLPAGLSLAANGSISGTPTVNGTGNFTVEVRDATNARQLVSFTLQVNQPGQVSPPVITPVTLPVGIVGTLYAFLLSVSGGMTPFSFTVSAGQLPAGLSLTSAGVITGTPTTEGTTNFSIQVTDVNGMTTATPLSITVNAPAPPAPAPTPAPAPSTMRISIK